MESFQVLVPSKNLLEETVEMCHKNNVMLVAPNIHRWYNQFLAALVTFNNNLKEPEALYFMMLLTKSPIIATVLLLLDVLECTAPLNLALQKGGRSLNFSTISGYLNLTITKLNGIKQAPKSMKIEQFTELKQSVENKILKLSILANDRNNDKFVWRHFFIIL